MLAVCFTGDTEQKIRVLVQESIFELQENNSICFTAGIE